MAEFADDFRAEIAEEYEEIINDRKDPLSVARVGGMSPLATWLSEQTATEVAEALDCGDPVSIDRACARIALAALMLRDASRAFGKMLQDAHEYPEAEREQRITAAMRLHAGKRKDSEVPA